MVSVVRKLQANLSHKSPRRVVGHGRNHYLTGRKGTGLAHAVDSPKA